MQFTALALAILPALALADAGPAQDAATTKLTKTVILSQVPHPSSTQCHNTTSTSTSTSTTSTTTFYYAHNTTSYMPTGSVASHSMPLGTASAFTTAATGAAGPSDTATTPPSASSSKGPLNAAGVLDASNVAFAGVVGMLAVALM